jgi:hypothetical protein
LVLEEKKEDREKKKGTGSLLSSLSLTLSLCFPPSHRLILSHSVSFVSQTEESKEGMRKKEKGEERKKEGRSGRVSEGEGESVK